MISQSIHPQLTSPTPFFISFFLFSRPIPIESFQLPLLSITVLRCPFRHHEKHTSNPLLLFSPSDFMALDNIAPVEGHLRQVHHRVNTSRMCLLTYPKAYHPQLHQNFSIKSPSQQTNKQTTTKTSHWAILDLLGFIIKTALIIRKTLHGDIMVWKPSK